MKINPKRIKKAVRKELLPLYKLHAVYLARMVKTLAQKDSSLIKEFRNHIPSWEMVATCQEVAINTFFSAQIATHNHPLGREAEYSSHPKCPGRDNRVRIIWQILYHLLSPKMVGKLDIYKNMKHTRAPLCPICEESVYEREVLGEHEDGTENFRWILSNDHYAHLWNDESVNWAEISCLSYASLDILLEHLNIDREIDFFNEIGLNFSCVRDYHPDIPDQNRDWELLLDFSDLEIAIELWIQKNPLKILRNCNLVDCRLCEEE